MKYHLKELLILLKSKVNSKPKVKKTIMLLLKYSPTLQQRLISIGQIPTTERIIHKLEYSKLSPRTKEIYYKLKATIIEKKSIK